ncbi:Coiled-coil domain-containing protein 25 [Lobulomyces angularis]|nr:Coiled-coil domain-containing protein 25 [Lobulomyces angularis]
MGKDKYENEDLIKHGFEEDVWFHVDKLSSAHVYLRMKKGQTWDNLPEALINDLAQLTKANSIEGNKKDNVTIIYTPWSNLKKTAGMETGQVKKVLVPARENAIINRLNKTKNEEYPDLQMQKVNHLKKKRAEERSVEKSKNEKFNRDYEEQKRLEDLITYKNVLLENEMKSNKECPIDEEDFM